MITRAVPSRPWAGTASLEVAYIWLYKQQWQGEYTLDDKIVAGITAFLTTPGKSLGNPHQLIANQNKSYIGSYTLGMGFVLTPEEAQVLIDKDPKNQEVLFPYLNGEDLNSRPDQSPSRWVINFKDYPLDAEHDDSKKPKGAPYASDYPNCLAILRERVKPERSTKAKDVAAAPWWQFWRIRSELYGLIEECDRVLLRARIANMHSVIFVPNNWVYNEKLVVFTDCSLAILQSNIHEIWAREYSSSLKKDMQYTPSDCFETFPFPTPDPSDLSTQFPTLDTIGETYYTHRQSVMRDRQEGLTKTYNRFHNTSEMADDIQKLRSLHIEMDEAVAAAYQATVENWHDLDLEHDFHQTKQGIRFTISETARREVLDRLLELNHKRYAEEVAQGLHEKKGKSKKAKGKTTKKQKTTGDDPQEEQISLF
ncbi:hypothetical protein C7B65_26435 [Phormidesmis priestleyi ULC007]|uniref:site-specific DNA-methyltransferase (adenine-specific) n=1 Tax=Phormidesmis priestleyi ULC007 TaxID=1920490 RepID=A0A2T1D1W8_9CYAN|nr:type IIL restriction-modification enzyme MmeI [Phormidesmis priestleyi]PSB14431.1 hypothetical protein C7B65_26435 [Phormidesmis priestleyi ULC007]PZO45452.1 MAG: hypothetical protein DCF14_24950 [Phormidesmis priestleyi]